MKKFIMMLTVGLVMFVGVVAMSHFSFAQEVTNTIVNSTTDTGTDDGTPAIFLVGSALATAIAFIVGALKQYAKLPAAWAPAAAFVVGTVSGLVAFYTHLAPAALSLVQCLIYGAMLGGTATGLYSIKKSTFEALYGEKKA